jgi:hypothetical protein
MMGHVWSVALLLISFGIETSKAQIVTSGPTFGTAYVGRTQQFTFTASVPTGSVAGVIHPALGMPKNGVLSCQMTNTYGCSNYVLNFSPSPDQAGQNLTVCVLWSSYPTAASSTSGCITVNVQYPHPAIVQPSGSWYYGGRLYNNPNAAMTYSFRANIGCLMSVPIQVSDSAPNSPYSIVVVPLVQSSFPPSPTGLPQPVAGTEGAAHLALVKNVFEFQWRPVRGQESSKHYQVCFEATDSEGITSSSSTRVALVARSVCFRILVEKCQYCVQPGDSFGTIATQFNTDWLHIYTANPTVLDPDNLVPYTRINTGVFYQVQQASSRQLSLIARNLLRFLLVLAPSTNTHLHCAG